MDEQSVIECLEKGICFFPNLRKKLKVSKDVLLKRLGEMVANKQLYHERSTNCYYLLKHGKLDLKEAGYGFIMVEGETEDYYVPKGKTKGAYDQDDVSFFVTEDAFHKKCAEIVAVLKRNRTTMIGKYKEVTRKGKTKAYVVSTHPKFPVKAEVIGGKPAEVGMIVYGKLQYTASHVMISIEEVLGHKDDPGIEIAQIALEYGFVTEFNEDVIEEIAGISDVVLDEQKIGRTDYTDLLTITIDGDDSKDFDDAVWVRKNQDGTFDLGVFIADVSEYVKEGHPLDQAALARGTSVYLADRVLPMLPHKLSNGICSLNEGVERLVLACIMKLSKEGNLLDYEITEGFISSKHRMTYRNVNAILDGDGLLREKYADIVPMLETMVELSAIIRRRREKKGGIEFDIPEYSFSLNEDGSPLSIELRVRKQAEKMIEDFMLQANETVAYHMNIFHLPCVYRVHEKPDQEKLRDVFAVIGGMGITLKQTKNDIHPKQVQDALMKIADSPYQTILSQLLLRSMMKARYTPECLGHYGLAMQYYCHFTSPIRRYPDLMVHRLIKKTFLHPDRLEEDLKKYQAILGTIADENSISERKAIECERAVNDMLYAWYMESHIGQIYQGVITSMVSFGMFVTLENGVEGLVSLSSLPGYFTFDKEKMCYYSKERVYHLGQRVSVAVASANRLSRKVDFRLPDEREIYENSSIE